MKTSVSSLTLLSLAISSNLLLATENEVNHDLPIQLVHVIEVIGEKTENNSDIHVSSQAPLTKPTHDAGELLRSVTGMTALRRGGRGFDPIIRGQSQNRINVITDGGFSFGGCPGRMDPATTYVGLDSFDDVTVVKGNRSVIYGSGGSGGTLIFEHQRPQLNKDGYSGNISAGYTSNSDLSSLSADVAFGTDDMFIRIFGENKSSDNYEDGNGTSVASAFESSSHGVIVGGNISDDNYLELAFESANEDDIWYSGNAMDAVYADSTSVRAKWKYTPKSGFFDSIEANIYSNEVDHLMDNYTVRNRNAMPNGNAVPTTSDTSGGRFIATIIDQDYQLKLGFDQRSNDRLATLYVDLGKDGSYDSVGSLMWPEVEQSLAGLFAELDYKINPKDNLRVGLRFDEFSTDAARAEEMVGMMGAATPTTLYQNFYNTNISSTSDNEVGFVFGWDRTLDSGILFSANLSRSVRMADATEQYMARNMMGNFWVGNPEINSEVHQQLDLTFISNGENLNWSTTVFFDEVNNFIERYQQDTASLYRNVDATLYGIEIDLSKSFTDNLTSRIGIAYVRGEGDNGDLPQISPLEARINLDYTDNDWSVGAEWVIADRQTHFDPVVDVDEETAGFGVLHLYGNWQFNNDLRIEAGIENLLDKSYAFHVNAANLDPFNLDAIRVNEPGRQIWTKLRYSF